MAAVLVKTLESEAKRNIVESLTITVETLGKCSVLISI